jgi:gluconolactonase
MEDLSAVSVLAEGLAHPEGPDLLPDGRVVLVETFRGRLSAWDRQRGLHVYAEVGGCPCACMLGTDGIYVTETGPTVADFRSPDPRTPSVRRIAWDGTVELIADSVDGEPLQAPNDLSFGPDGRLYFTDPAQYNPDVPTDGRVCAISGDGTTELLVDVGPTYPNGVTVEGDGSVVWVESYTRRIRRWRPDGSVELITTLPENHIPDGLKVGQDDNLYIASVTSGGIDVVAPDGRYVRFIETGGEPQNCVFDGDALIVADFGELPAGETGLAAGPACGRLLRVHAGVNGRPLFRGAIVAGG